MTDESRRPRPRADGVRSSAAYIVPISESGKPMRLRLDRPTRAPVGRPDGEIAVMVGERAYDRMMERLEALEARAAYDRTRGDESFPAAVARRLATGDRPIRVFREHRGLTLQRLADAIGKSKAYLSEIESGKKTGSAHVLKAIATALGVAIDDVI